MIRMKTSPILLKRLQANPLPVMEHFYTLQGEGAWSGTPTYFIRLSGCDVGCSWCDVKESWIPKDNAYYEIDEIVTWVKASNAQRVVITGGEPSIYDLRPLTKALHQAGLLIHIETAGPHTLYGNFDWICFSPKKFLPPQEEYYSRANELKVVVFNAHDFKWAEMHAEKCAPHVQLFLQAEWSRRERFYPEIVKYIKSNPKWRMSMQTHKYLEIP